MLFKEFGQNDNPAIILIHGGGLSYWMWMPQIDALKNDYRIITPIIDGHGDDFTTTFISITDCAEKIITYIKQNCLGKVYAICGLSLGAQILIEILSRESFITEKALIESAMVIPIKSTQKLVKSAADISYPLAKKRWFSKLQSKQLYIADEMFELYFEDSKKITKQSLLNILMDNSNYTLPEGLQNSTADAIVLCGKKEYSTMKKSAEMIHNNLRNSSLIIFDNCGHGVSIKYPNKYLGILMPLLNNLN